MFNALLAAFSNASETLLDKTIMSKERVTFTACLSLTMFFVFIFTSSLFPFLGRVQEEAFTLKYLIPFAGVILIAFCYNYLYYYSLQHENITEVEPLIMIHSLLAVLLAAIVFPSERNMTIFILAIIASLALIFSRIEKKHLNFDKHAFAMLGFAFLFAVESLFLKDLLTVYSPLALYAIRVGVLDLFFFLILRPKLNKLNKLNVASLALNGLIVSVQYIALYFAISKIGLIRTSLIWTLSPFLIFVFSLSFLKEKVVVKKLLADAVILACVVASVFV